MLLFEWKIAKISKKKPPWFKKEYNILSIIWLYIFI